ncbi:Hypothetical protein POVR1_LOCUS378 [uncultured virus]|nr:Hypothetical protein POVR1_LOCUS378 [uncultured virus]
MTLFECDAISEKSASIVVAILSTMLVLMSFYFVGAVASIATNTLQCPQNIHDRCEFKDFAVISCLQFIWGAVICNSVLIVALIIRYIIGRCRPSEDLPSAV